MKSIKKIRLILTLCSLLIASVSLNAQVVIKDCGGGVTVGGNDSCPRVNRPPKVEYVLIPRWGALSVDISMRTEVWGSGSSTDGLAEAGRQSVTNCRKLGGKNCQVVHSYKNTCGAVASTTGNRAKVVFGTGTDINETIANRKAIVACEANRPAGNTDPCSLWISALCAGSPTL